MKPHVNMIIRRIRYRRVRTHERVRKKPMKRKEKKRGERDSHIIANANMAVTDDIARVIEK